LGRDVGEKTAQTVNGIRGGQEMRKKNRLKETVEKTKHWVHLVRKRLAQCFKTNLRTGGARLAD